MTGKADYVGRHEKRPEAEHVHSWQSQGSDPGMGNMIHWQCTAWCEMDGTRHAETWLPQGKHPNSA